MTTITFRVSNCEGCTIQGQRATEYAASDVYDGPAAKVTKGVATMSVPTAKTAGMIFLLTPPAAMGGFDAQPMIAFQYDREAVGLPVTAVKARNAKRARPCWAGTNEAAALLRVRVRWTPLVGTTEGTRGRVPIAWVTPSQAAPLPSMSVHFRQWPKGNGVLATQDYVVCKV